MKKIELEEGQIIGEVVKKDNELVTKGAVKEAIRKEMSRTGGFTCGSHGVMCGDLVEAINKLPSEKRKERVV